MISQDSFHHNQSVAAVGTDVAEQDLFYSSSAQERLWFIDQLEPNSTVYIVHVPLYLQGALNVAVLRHCINIVIQRHEALRVSFVNVNGLPMQRIALHLEIPVPVFDLSDLSDTVRQEEIRRLVSENIEYPFNLACGPLIRGYLLRIAPEEHILGIAYHHIIADQWSVSIFWNEVCILYNAELSGQPAQLPELSIQYIDYAEWQHQRLQGEVIEDLLAYWRQQLDDAPQTLAFLTDQHHQTQEKYTGGQHYFQLPADLSQKIRLFTQHEGVTLFMTLLAAFQTLLMRYSGQDDIIVGTPIAGRERTELEPLIGLFINTLALRTDLSGDPSFKQLLRRVREVCLGAYEHQEVPFEMVIEDLHPDRSAGKHPLFQTMFVLQNTPDKPLHFDGITIKGIYFTNTTSKFDLELGFWDEPGALKGDLSYNAKLFSAAMIERFVRHFQTLLENVMADPELTLSHIPLITATESQHLLDSWRAPKGEDPQNRNVPQLFEQQTAHTPDAIAFVWRNEHITFAELDRRANRLARYLQRLNIGPEECVGFCMERSPDAAIALLGIMKSGAAYLPIDPTSPRERIAYMLANSHVGIVLTQTQLGKLFHAMPARTICIDSERDIIAQESGAMLASGPYPEQTAYVIYTSGSTGTPKGVVVPHRALVDRILSIKSRYELRPTDRLLQFVSLSFDVSLEEIFPTWASGATLVMLPEEGVPSLADVSRLAHEQHLTVLDLPPSYWHEWVAELSHTHAAIPPSLRLIILGSESSSPAMLAVWQRLAGDQTKWVNVYGLTETTLIAMTYGPGNNQDWQQYSSIPIGRPLDNTREYVLDRNLQPAPIDVPGELYLGGPGLARGYMERPDLTAERFIPDPFEQTEPGARMYRTGDLVRTLPNGLLEFLGRVDSQVKVRGFRVELSEIETVLRQYPGIREVVVLAVEEKQSSINSDQRDAAQKSTRLAAYIVTARQTTAMQTRLQRYLETHLPAYMVPSTLVMLQTLPRTPGGKIDRKALIAMLDAKTDRNADHIEFKTTTERLLAEIWEAVLQSVRIDRSDDFFKLGGHSLQATQVVARIRNEFGVELPVRAIYDAPTISAQSERIDRLRSDANRPAPIRAVPRQGALPLSFAQQRLWFLHQMESGSALYNIPGALLLHGPLHIEALEYSLHALILRHEPLRTTFAMVNDLPVQDIAPDCELILPVVDLSNITDIPERLSLIHHFLTQEAQYSFDLQHGPLLHALLLRLGPDEHALSLTLHHIVSDGWSAAILYKELDAFYRAFLQRTPANLPELTIQYADYAVWQREWLQGAALDEQLNYWQHQLDGAPAVLALPTDFPRPAQMSYRGSHLAFKLDSALSAELRALSQREGVTLFMLLLAAFQVVLMRYTGQEDIIVGTPVAGRQQRETEDLIGFFINTLAIRTKLSGNPTFAAALQHVREACLDAYSHQEIPFEKLVDVLRLDRNLSYTPLFQVLFALQHDSEEVGHLGDVVVSGMEATNDTSKFDLSMTVTETESDLYVWLEYSTDIFRAETIARFFAHWQQLLRSIAVDPQQRIAALPLLTEAEEQQIVIDWNATATNYPRTSTIPAIFDEIAAAAPDAVAVVFADAHLTYAELNRRANQLAQYLRSLGVGPESPVGVCQHRSLDLIISLLAILKAGGFYVPVDPSYPADRLAFLLSDAQVSAVLTSSTIALPPLVAAIPIVQLDQIAGPIARFPTTSLPITVGPDHLAYVNYTSGSTGVPKGVCIPHRAVLRLVKGNTFARLTAQEVFLQLATVSFDAATLEIWGPLLNGGRLVVAPAESPTLETLGQVLQQEHITTLWLTAGLFHVLVEEQVESLRGVRQLLAGGDVLSAPHVRKALEAHPGMTLINGYGPTEGTTFTCCYPMTNGEQVGENVSIGRPIANTQVYILDARQRPVPVGVSGELYIGGDGLARGYLGRPELTAEKFVPHPLSRYSGERLYRTGDLARCTSDGLITFLGRIDRQVKIRGYRIELGEIEYHLLRHPRVRDCVVVARRENATTSRLIAYITTTQSSNHPPEDLRSYLKGRLPEYMIPSQIVEMDALPLNATGKVDRHALPDPAQMQTILDELPEMPRTTIEESLAGIWMQTLRRDRVGIHDNFFELGGDSIMCMQVIARARQAGIQLTPKQLFQYQTIAELATVAEVAATPLIEQGPVTGPVLLTPIQHWFFEQDLAEVHYYNQAALLETPVGVDTGLLKAALQALLVHHDALRLRFERIANDWRQYDTSPDEIADSFFEQHDLSLFSSEEQAQQLETIATTLQANLDIQQGPLLRAALFHLGADQPGRLLIAIHHLAVDGVSWRILLEDLAMAYQKLLQGSAIHLPPKTTSYQDWAERLAAYAQSQIAMRSVNYWVSGGRRSIAALPVDHHIRSGENIEQSAQAIHVGLSATETQALAQDVPKAYHTQINDVLLAAVAIAFHDWTGSPTVLIDLEGHGREAILEQVNLSRTVGWFTSIFPLYLDIAGQNFPGQILTAIKEQLRAIPNRGIDYGILRYLSQDHALVEQLQALPSAEVSFNYLGQFDASTTESNLFKYARESGGASFSMLAQRRYLLEILGNITGGQLYFTWVYSERIHNRATIERLAHRFIAALRELIAHCLSPEAGGHTPSDFPLARLDAKKLSKLSLLIDEDQ